MLLLAKQSSLAAQSDEIGARATAMELVRKAEGFEASHPLRATRREDWEDDLFGLQVRVQGRIAKAAFFFEVTQTGYFVLSPNEAVYVGSDDGIRIWIVAVASQSGEPIGLFGFPNPEDGFRELTSLSQLRIDSADDAKRAALLYFATVQDPGAKTLVSHALDLKHQVEDFFFARLPEAQAQTAASRWWSGFQKGKPTALGSAAEPSENSYRVSTTRLVSQDRNTLELVELSYQVSASGVCEQTGRKTRFRGR